MQKWPLLELCAGLGAAHHGVRSSAGGRPRPSVALPPAILPFDCTLITVSMQSGEKSSFWLGGLREKGEGGCWERVWLSGLMNVSDVFKQKD